MGQTGYRDHELGARQRLEELLARQQEHLRDLGEMPKLYGRRLGRIAGGGVATLLGLAFLGLSLLVPYHPPTPGVTLAMLCMAWCCAFIFTTLGNFLGVLTLPRLARQLARPSGDLHRDLARLEAAPHPAALVVRSIDRLELASIALPLTGAALLLPLTLHLPFALAMSGLEGFDQWCRLSAIIVGHAHLVLAALFVRHAVRVRRARNPAELKGGGRILGWTILASAIPGIMCLGLPPILTGITGLVFIPMAASAAAGRAHEERQRLEDAGRPRPEGLT
jgi:hypothetical protein